MRKNTCVKWLLWRDPGQIQDIVLHLSTLNIHFKKEYVQQNLRLGKIWKRLYELLIEINKFRFAAVRFAVFSICI